jgi:cysteine desulfurase
VRNLTIEPYYISLIRFRKVYLQRAIISSASKQFEVKEHNMNGKIYLDYAATTPVDERVLQAMMPYFTGTFGNPSSVHFFGQQAEAALEEARQMVADCLNASPDEIVFTGCGSESDNLALRGAAFVQSERRGANHILISPVEHHAVSRTAYELASHHGFEVEMLPVDSYGRVDPADVQARLRPETAIVSVIYGNNEIGTVNPVADIAKVCREKEIPFHTDAVQAAAHLAMDVQSDGVDLLAMGAHKFYGPKGVGVLYRRAGMELIPSQSGGGQEGSLRAGTHNVPYIVGMAAALSIAQTEAHQRSERYLPMRDRLIQQVLERIPRVQLTGHPVERLPNHASFAFEGVDGNALVMMLDVAGFAVSSGSACKVGSPEASEVLLAIGLPREWSLGSLRVTLGTQTDQTDLDRLADVLPEIVERVRAFA